MNLIDKKVTHKQFGEGVIVSITDFSVKVQFSVEEKKFMYPEGFSKYLTLHDKTEAKVLHEILQVKEVEKKAAELLKEQDILKHRKKQKQQLEYDKLTNNHKLHPESQVVFWCDEEESHRVFEKGQVFVGEVKSGVNKGKPVKMNRVHQNSAVLLTSKEPGTQEEDRLIHGVFMVKKGYIGKLNESGFIPAHSNYNIQLSEEESKQMPFWKYYKNKKSPNKISWNTGKYKYFDNEWMAQIILDIYSIKKDPMEKQMVQQFLFHFCKMNNISVDDITLPKGLLTLSK